jgi:hypothetical protein
MIDDTGHPLNEQYTSLSDRFRSLWTFYQFLGGVFKHLGRGSVPIGHDLQHLHRRLQDALPQPGLEDITSSGRELELIDAELKKIHTELSTIEEEFAPSLLRRFFDHLKRQDQKILFALAKFYLMAEDLNQDHMDKLDILLTRLAEAPSVDNRSGVRDLSEMQVKFERLADFAGIGSIPVNEEEMIIEALRSVRNEISGMQDFKTLMHSGILDRYRKYKHGLGLAFLRPPILLEIIATNSEAKESFSRLYQDEETRILKDTNRIFEIERYVDRNPDMAHPELLQQLETFKKYQVQFDSGRKEDNVKGDDVIELRQAMMGVIEAFDTSKPGTVQPTVPASSPGPSEAEPGSFFAEPAELPVAEAADSGPVDLGLPDAVETAPAEELSEEMVVTPAAEIPDVTEIRDDTEIPPLTESGEGQFSETLEEAAEPYAESLIEAPSIIELLQPEPTMVAALEKIAYPIEMVISEYPAEQAASSQELHHLRLEVWEVAAFNTVTEMGSEPRTMRWELARFFLLSAALRVKLEAETEEIQRLDQASESERLLLAVGQATQSLELASRYDKRFQWFIDGLELSGETERSDQINLSRFRFLQAYSRLWLEHHAFTGAAPV